MFFVFEGIDGSGKSTQARRLAEHLRAASKSVVTVREPGGTALGERIRELLFEPGSEGMSVETELFLFMAARSHLVKTRIAPALAAGEIVISDRFLWSSVAYQGAAGTVPTEEILRMGRLAVADAPVALTLVIDVDPRLAHARATGRNRMEERGLDFQERVRDGFRQLVVAQGEGAVLVDGDGSEDEVHARVLAALPEGVTNG
jgi:dTMP kinase